MRQLSKGVDIVVGTPGRVYDLYEKEYLWFDKIQSVVMDEADHMLDIGFEKDMEQILEAIKKSSDAKPQVLLFSATLPEWIHRNAQKHQNADRVYIDAIGNVINRTAEKIKHLAVPCDDFNLGEAVGCLLSFYAQNGKAMIFAETKIQVEQLNEHIKFSGGCGPLHGDLSQAFREKTLSRFRAGQINCLIATDVAARGLDIPDVDVVIQIEPPRHTESFIHRAGRTARAGKDGTCIVLFNPRRNLRELGAIEKEAGVTFTKVPFPSGEKILSNQMAHFINIVSKNSSKSSDEIQTFASKILDHFDGDAVKVTQGLLQSLTGSLSTHLRSSLTGMINFKTFVFKTNTQLPIPRLISLLEDSIPGISISQFSKLIDENGVAFDVRQQDVDKVKSAFGEIGSKLSNFGTLEEPATLSNLEIFSRFNSFSSRSFDRPNNGSFNRADNGYSRHGFAKDRFSVRSSFDGRDRRGNRPSSGDYNRKSFPARKVHVPFI